MRFGIFLFKLFANLHDKNELTHMEQIKKETFYYFCPLFHF
jgi:hypothetical protein